MTTTTEATPAPRTARAKTLSVFFTSKFFPQLPQEFVAPTEEALLACERGEEDTLIEVPRNSRGMVPRDAEYDDEGRAWLSAWEWVNITRTEWLLEDEMVFDGCL